MALILVFSLVKVARIHQIYSEGDADYDAVAAQYALPASPEATPEPASPAPEGDAVSGATYPFSERPDVDFAGLLKENPDTSRVDLL